MLLIDGVRYFPRAYNDEAELEQAVKEHAKEIFGGNCLYFGDFKKRVKSTAGVGSIPDGWAVDLGIPVRAYPVEIELSSHDVYGHISPQIDKIHAALNNPATQHQIVSAIYDEITKDSLLNSRAKANIGSSDLHKVLSDSISGQQVQLVIVIDCASQQLQECAANKSTPPKIIEFATFCREGVGLAVHIHQFEPLFKPAPSVSMTGRPSLMDTISVAIRISSWIKWTWIEFPKEHRSFFPGFKIPFELETDIDTILVRVVGGHGDSRIGDPGEGYYIQKGLKPWFEAHPELKVGSQLKFEALEPHKRYKLSIVSP
jgi:hypothetical protein